MKKFIYFVIFILISFSLLAAPSLMITEPPVTSQYPWTGPVQDPDAIKGQWFKDNLTGAETYRTHEFYDNVESDTLHFGGGFSSYTAIHGFVFSIITDPSGAITSFVISATIKNDTPALSPWADGFNSHDEALATDNQYEGTLFYTKLTAEFALSGGGAVPIAWTPPYMYNDWPDIYAEDHDQLAWYCWTPGNTWEDPPLTPYGGYFVPTWDFGNIASGGSAQLFLHFTVAGIGIVPEMDPRFSIIMESLTAGDASDIFLNRTTSLKISTWMDDLSLDTGIPYPDFPLRGSDVSVFHNDNDDPPLPVELSSFYGNYINGTPTLYWTTESEIDNAYWNVYRGTNNNFTEAIHLNANYPVAGNGTTNEISEYVYVDVVPVVQNTTYWYWIESVSEDGETEVQIPITLEIPYENNPNVPDTYGLHQNFPNPFNPSTLISFALKEESDVELIIYNVKGEKIKTIFNEHVNADEITSAVWNGKDANDKDVASGVYFYKLITNTKEYQKKMLLVK